ncbi:MAG: Esterase/lipase [Erysipelotrichaceae bacterium]|nr:MAG: hypothetical protein FD179_96 [Erysipelotrichaceae bacterium]TXT18212.1 MAG: Esterase/lipase [Erysipelotrichaceae bacterium]
MNHMQKWILRIKAWLKSRREAKLPVIYCVHGFGVRKTVEFLPLKMYFEDLGHKVVCVELFDQRDPNDTDPQQWLQRAEDGLAQLIAQERKVWLIGFSMGGVIATYLSTLYSVERLVLLAPAFEYLSLQNVKGAAKNVARTIIKKPRTNLSSNYPPLPTSFSPVFRSIIALCRDSIGKVDVPVLFLHGSDDETIPIRSSENAYAKVPHEMKLLLVIAGVMHRLLDDDRLNQDILKLIDDFFNERLLKEIPIK